MNSIKYIMEISPDTIIDVINNELVRIQIEEMTGTLKIKARISPESDFQTIKLIDENYQFVEEAQNIGFYSVDVMGYNSIIIECEKTIKGFISGCN